jgi:hypothetical protein
MEPGPGRSGILVVRAWIEGEGGAGLRARITRSPQVEGEEPLVTTTASVDEACATVRDWLEELRSGAP